MGKNLDLQDLDLQDLDVQTKALYMAFESSQARIERVNFKLWIVILVLIVTLIGTNAGWIWYENQWKYVDTTTVTQDVEAQSDDGSDLNLNTIGGDYYGGESESNADGITN